MPWEETFAREKEGVEGEVILSAVIDSLSTQKAAQNTMRPKAAIIQKKVRPLEKYSSFSKKISIEESLELLAF